MRPREEENTAQHALVESRAGVEQRAALTQPTDHEEGLSPKLAADSLSHRRPFTRSQTGRVSKRKRAEDDDTSSSASLPEPRSRVVRPRTQKSDSESDSSSTAPSNHPTPSAESPDYLQAHVRRDAGDMCDDNGDDDDDASVHDAPSPKSITACAGDVPTLSATQLSFLDTSSISSSSSVPGSVDVVPAVKSRASLPIPVPNLTKKSRGRRVPTKQPSGDGVADPMDSRIYVCQVENCGKCFHRGEHLKRHIRSIHTHEKPFKCSHPLCDKHFNRHDNLLQHLKVHKQIRKPSRTPSTDREADGLVQSTNTHPPSVIAKARPRTVRIERTSSPPRISSPPPPSKSFYPSRTLARVLTPPTQEAYEPPRKHGHVSSSTPIYHSHPPLSSSSSSSNSYRGYATYRPPLLSEPSSFAATKMAVSSLRTELPQSPPTSALRSEGRRRCESAVSDERSRARYED